MSEPNPDTTAGKPAQKITAIMYIGPNRAYNLPLSFNQVFADGNPPAFCNETLAAHPHFACCFVPISELGNGMRQLRDKTSDLTKTVAKIINETANLKVKTAKGDN